MRSLTAGMVLHAAPASRQQQEAAVPGLSSGGRTAGRGGAGSECLTCTCDRRSTEAPCRAVVTLQRV